MAESMEEPEEDAPWRPTVVSLLLIGIAVFCAAVGVADVVLGERAIRWLAAAAVLILLGVLAGQ